MEPYGKNKISYTNKDFKTEFCHWSMNKQLPIIGQEIYVPTTLFLGRGRDDFEGGKATINKVDVNERLAENHPNRIFVGIKERPTTLYNWNNLVERQDELREFHKDQIAHPVPDLRPEFNEDIW